MTPEECDPAEVLRQLVSQALLETNASEITGTAVTIPAAFNQMQSEATLRAAAAAGLDRVIASSGTDRCGDGPGKEQLGPGFGL